jgi:hypothetical protein
MCYTNLKKLPLRFASVTGDFVIRCNKLTTLEGCPTEVGGDFDCKRNDLTSLEFSPIKVGRNYNCQENNLILLRGVPEEVPNTFWCAINNLQSLENGPKSVGGNYLANHNQISSLEGSPSFVGGSFTVSANPLINLVGCPKHIGNTFSFDHTILSLYMGDRDCQVPIVRMEKLKNFDKNILRSIPQSILNRHLRLLFKYNGLSEVWTSDGSVNNERLDDMIFEIDDGML